MLLYEDSRITLKRGRLIRAASINQVQRENQQKLGSWNGKKNSNMDISSHKLARFHTRSHRYGDERGISSEQHNFSKRSTKQFHKYQIY